MGLLISPCLWNYAGVWSHYFQAIFRHLLSLNFSTTHMNIYIHIYASWAGCDHSYILMSGKHAKDAFGDCMYIIYIYLFSKGG